ncbi:hypothetical protein RHSIM_Rhsim07G0152600 [Rhododendron simsii]|uniref:HAT C-terminal dimerisation domain-containing protein n=1 Tax=Rhododendron simsii TaxID=118357 RepID=A0A834GQT7_RHOSS|nr:hypothetical protein RHSIM_Rhsim07G0152600 [Rhododendron simsii]
MDAGNFNLGKGEDRDPHSDSSSDDELPRNPVVQQGMDSIGEEAASNIVGGGTGPLGSTSTPTDSLLQIQAIVVPKGHDARHGNSTLSDMKKAHSEYVASESAFSVGKRVLDERRSRLAPNILDCLICLKDWEEARLGIEKCSAKDEFRGYFADSDIESD